MNGNLDLLAFSGAMVLAQFSPGPDMVLLTRTALKNGVRAGVAMALGIACGLAVHATVAVAGLALAFERSPGLREGLRWAAVAYLLWLAFGLLREAAAGGKVESLPEAHGRGPFLRGLCCNLLNPKAVIFLAAISAPFLSGERPHWWPLALWGIVVVQSAVLWSLWARLLQWLPLRQRYERARRWIDAAFGLVLVALALRLIQI
jgi:threonine/homoserine/homoserine lactone efflux protein